jgi:magnesium chelatase family protein
VAASQVRAARELQMHRAGKLNVDLAGAELRRVCRLDREARLLLAQLRAKFELSARGVHRVLRVARTIADLEAAAPATLASRHIAEALQLRRAV